MIRPAPASRGMGLFSLLWLGQLVSFVGTAMTSFALGIEVFQTTGSVTRFALVNLSAALPILLVSPFAGALADRLDRRWILIAAQFGSIASNGVLLFLLISGRLATWHIYPLVAVSAVFGSFVWPTFAAAVTLIVGKANFARASGMIQMGASLAQIAGPLLAGMLLLPIGLDGIVRLNIVSYLFAASVLLLVRFPGAAPAARTATGASGAPGTRAPLSPGSGWAFVRARPGLLRLLMIFAAINFAVGMVQVLITPLVLAFATPRVLGLVVSIASSGALVGGTVMSVWGGPRKRVAAILAVVGVQGLLLMVGGLSPNATLIAAAAFFFLLGFPIATGASQAIWQSKTPPDIQGRVFAVRRMVAGCTIPLAQAAAGPLADYVFEPSMAPGGALATALGPLLGVGAGRGIGLIYLVLGAALVLGALLASRSRAVTRLEQELPDAVPDDEDGGGVSSAGTGRDGAGVTAAGERPLAGVSPAAATILLALILLGALTPLLLRPPPDPGLDAPAEAFSAARALPHVEAIAQRPHPTGSREQAAVRDYLRAQLAALGLDAEVQRSDSVADGFRVAALMTVENVVGRLPGSGRDGARRAVLLVAHYDSVPSAPGAADNGSGVAALLETARALAAGPPLRNDVVFLFSDAEEAGLHGARAFARDHRWARDVALVFNLDARGHRGLAYVFETGDDNGWWLPRFLRAAPRPAASSIMSAIYDRLPNATDFTVFRERGHAGFNAALLNGLDHYHNQLDRPADLDRRSLQHQGGYALALARMAGALDLSAPEASRKAPNRAYFNLLGPLTVHYGQWLAWLGAAAAALGYLAVIFFGLRRRRLSVFGLAQGLLAAFATLVSVPVAVTLVWLVVRDTAQVPVIMGSTAAAGRYMMAFAALAVAAVLALQRFFRDSVGLLDLFVGGLAWWLLAVVLTSGTLLPVETNFLAVWPLLGALAAAAWLCATPAAAWTGGRTVAVLALAALPALLLLPPFVAAAYVAMQSLFQLGGGALLPLVMLLLLLLPLLEAIAGRRDRWPPIVAAAVGVALLGWALSERGPEREMASAVYTWDVDSGARRWFSIDPEVGDWTRQFGFVDGTRGGFETFFPLLPPALVADAPDVAGLPRPELRRLGVTRGDGWWAYRLELEPADGARGRLISFEPRDVVTSVRIGDRVVKTTPPTWLLVRLPIAGTEEITVRARSDAPVTMVVIDQLEGFPTGIGVEPRPAGVLTRPMFSVIRSDVTLIRRSFSLGVGADEAR